MHLRRSALALVLMATLAGCGTTGATPQCDLASTALTAGQLATAAELYARAQQGGEGECADSGLDSVGNRYASAFREAARGTALEVAADNAGAQAAYQSALALDQGNQPAMNGLTRLGVPQEQRITSLPLPAVPPYPQATVWTGWPIVLPAFVLALAALTVALLHRRSAAGSGPGSAAAAEPRRPGSWWGADRRAGRRRKLSNEEGPPEDQGYADTAAPDTDEPERRSSRDAPEPRLGSPVGTARSTPLTSEDARTDPITVVHPLPARSQPTQTRPVQRLPAQSLDLGRSDDPHPTGRAPRSHDLPAEDDDPEPAPGTPSDWSAPHDPPSADAEREPAHATEPAHTEPTHPEPTQPEPPHAERTAPAAPASGAVVPPSSDPAVAVQGAEIGQLQRLMDRFVRVDDRPLARRFFTSREHVPGPAIGVTLAVCVVGLAGDDPEARELLCVQRLVVAAVPGGPWAPAEAPAVEEGVASRTAGSVRDQDGRVWSTRAVADDRGLLRLVDAAGPAWTALLRGDDPPAGPLERPSTAESSALRAALEGRRIVVSPGPRPASVEVIALVDALLVEGALVNARVETHLREMPAVAAAESIESALAAELVDLQNSGSNP